MKSSINKTVQAKRLKRKLKCTICPPNKGENASRKPKHGVKTPKYKNKGKS